MAGLIPWGFTFHVSTSSDFETRYAELLAAHPVPSTCAADLNAGHETALALISSHGVVTPFTCTIQGGLDMDNANRSTVTVTVIQE